jgi:hypothetical protein
MRVGFTGTRDGMTRAQIVALNGWWEMLSVEEFHHGGCVGADADAVACALNFTRARITAHPGDIQNLTSWKAVEDSDVALPAKPCLERNRDIVDAADVLVACPKGEEEQRSGTWATVRYARRRGKRIIRIAPDGVVVEEPGRE